MVNPLVVAGCVAIGLGGLTFLVVGGKSRAEKRLAAVARAAPTAIGGSAQADRASRKKQIAEGLRELEKAN